MTDWDKRKRKKLNKSMEMVIIKYLGVVRVGERIRMKKKLKSLQLTL